MENNCNNKKCNNRTSCGSNKCQGYPKGFESVGFGFEPKDIADRTMNSRKISSLKVVSIVKNPKTELTVIEFDIEAPPYVILQTVTGIKRRYIIYSEANGYRKYFIKKVNGNKVLNQNDLTRLRKNQILRVVGQLKECK